MSYFTDVLSCIVSNYNRNEQSKPCNHTLPITMTLLIFVHTDKLTWVNKFSDLAIGCKPTTIYFELCMTSQSACFANLFLDVRFTQSHKVDCQNCMPRTATVHCHHLMSYGHLKVVNIFHKHILHLLE